MLFWILWGIDAAVSLICIYFFFIGLADGSVSSFNIVLWICILLALGAVLGGGYALRASGHLRLAYSLLSTLAIPGILAGFFILLLTFSKTPWR